MHLPEVDNAAADALSRIQTINMPVIVSTEDIADAQFQDQELQFLLEFETSNYENYA